ncbi:MAG: HNH endonuclease [Dehalococcoidia bacterium]|nr:HNH endonuclease [Dehalococcoidia bacterium]
MENSDEVRDLFIRLQSGTALTRQQIRDAWPGTLGPQVEQWAGKLTKRPKYSFFTAVDGRGTRDDEDDSNDPYVKHRTTCAQLCALLLTREGNPFAAPSIKAADLDALYHGNTQASFESLERIFDDLEDVISRVAVKGKGRRKVAKITLFALAMFLQDVRRSDSFRLLPEAKQKLAQEASEPSVTQNSRASSGGVIKDYYERWRVSLPDGIAAPLDSNRRFDAQQQTIIRERQHGRCAICNEPVEDGEYDHWPVPYRLGGRTTVENGRLVHAGCHERGRPSDH